MNSQRDQLANALQRLELDYSVEECHGMLCGLLCANAELSPQQWNDLLTENYDPDDLLVSESLVVMGMFYTETVSQLNDPQLGFTPLLPFEECAAEERVEALARWCDGFILGLSEGGIAEPAKLPGDCGEAIVDLLEITHIEHYERSGDEEDEVSLVELEEYVRAAVLLIYEDLNQTKAPPREEATLH